MHGFQLWANLPAVAEDDRAALPGHPGGEIPEVTDDDGTKARIIVRRVLGQARARWRAWPPIRSYVDISVPPGKRKPHQGRDHAQRLRLRVRRLGNVPRRVRSAGGADRVRRRPECPGRVRRENHSLVLFDRGDEIVVQAGREGIRFLLVSGKPLEEPVAWYGPIVMNTQEELGRRSGAAEREPSSATDKRRVVSTE